MSRRRGRRRHRRSRARATTSPPFPASGASDEPQDGWRRFFKVAMITMLVFVAVTTVVTETATVQWYSNNTPADTTSANLPPYRSWGYSTAGTDPEVASAHNTRKMFPVKPGFADDHTEIPVDMIPRDALPTNDPMPPVDEVRPLTHQVPTVPPDFGGGVQEEFDESMPPPSDNTRRRDRIPDIFKSWAFMTTEQRHLHIALMRQRIRKQIYEILHRKYEPKMPSGVQHGRHDFMDGDMTPADNHAKVPKTFSYSESPTVDEDPRHTKAPDAAFNNATPAAKLTQSALKPDTSTDGKPKGEAEKTETTVEDKVLLENAAEMTKNKTCHEGKLKHHVLRHMQRVGTVALAVVGVVAAGSVAYSCTVQIT